MNLAGFKRFLGLAGFWPTSTTSSSLTTVGNGTLTAAILAGGVVTRTGPTTAFTDTTTTGALLDGAVDPNTAIGSSVEFIYYNNTAFNATIAGATGITVSGNSVVPAFSTGRFLLTRTAAGTYTMVGLGVSGKVGLETVAATRVLTAAESGTVIILSATVEFDTKLPAPAVGLRFKFIVGAAPSGASYTITTDGTTQNIIVGCLATSDVVTASVADSETTGIDVITFVDGQAVVGDWVELVSDGTKWYVSGCSKVAAGITLA